MIIAILWWKKKNSNDFSTVEPLTNDHPHQRPSLSYDHISCDGLCILCVYESLTSDHPSYTTTPMWFWGWSYKRGSTVVSDFSMLLHFLHFHVKLLMQMEWHHQIHTSVTVTFSVFWLFVAACFSSNLDWPIHNIHDSLEHPCTEMNNGDTLTTEMLEVNESHSWVTTWHWSI